MHLMLQLVDSVDEVATWAVRTAWERWLGPQRFQRKLDQFARLGWIEPKEGTTDLPRIVRLTKAGRRAALGGRDPEACWRREWDGRWRMALFDVPETKRALRLRLGRKLRALHFGYLQNSAWISPDSAEELQQSVRGGAIDVESLVLWEARPCGGESNAQLVDGAWDFAGINRGYKNYVDLVRRMPTRSEAQSPTWRAWIAAEHLAWNRAVQADPLLPRELLPANYRGEEAWRQRRERFATLAKGL